MYEDINPKEYQADRKDYKDDEEISPPNRIMNSTNRQQAYADSQESTDSRASE